MSGDLSFEFKGISTFGDKPDLVGPEYLKPLLDHALNLIPADAIQDTPFFLLATAGVRLLLELQRKELLAQICSYTRSSTKFLLPDCKINIQVIPGETEGLYGWIAANYLLGGFDVPDKPAHGKGHHTYGFLDMGGASAQIAFAPNSTEADRHAEDLKLLRMRTINGAVSEYKVFVTTWLGFGVHEARRRYVDSLLESVEIPTGGELPDPCLPGGLSISTKGDLLFPGSRTLTGEEPHLTGTGRFEECLQRTNLLLDKNAPCLNPPCLLHGVHVPAIDFDVNHFVGVSEYWHTTHEIFEKGHKNKAYDFNTYQKRVMEFCSQDWKSIKEGIKEQTWGNKVDEATAAEVCFKASWLINMLHDGIGIPRIGLENTQGNGHNGTKEVLESVKAKGFTDAFQAVDKIDNTEVSWTLGKMVLYAASQVQPNDNALPVGFGSNIVGIPSDFQYAGGHPPLRTNITHDHDPHASNDEVEGWRDTLFEGNDQRRLPGFFLFMAIVWIAVFLLCGKDRRTRIYLKLLSLSPFSRTRRPGRRKGLFASKSSYLTPRPQNAGQRDRLLDDGIPSDDLELGTLDDLIVDDEHSDSSAGSCNTGKSSGWATPSIRPPNDLPNTRGEYSDSIVAQGVGLGLGPVNVMGRSGLFVRTESRERLNGGGMVEGRKSRRGSPTRFKTPMMGVGEED